MASGGNNLTVEEHAAKLRELFTAKHSADIEAKRYDERDLENYRTDDNYVASFIRSFETLQDACNHLHESLKFRHDFGINDLTVDSFDLEIWNIGAAYFHNVDKDGHRILYLQVNKHRKDPALLPIIKKCFAFILETESKKNPGKSIVVLFDLQGAGISHLDMEFIKYIINCFKLYYPKLLEYMLMFEMPWLFNAAWKVIKQMLHAESVKRIKFVTKTDIQEYINKDQLWEHMGGTDKYTYSFDPGVFDVGGGGDDSDLADGIRKRVTFADPDNPMFKSVSNDSLKEVNGQAIKVSGNINSSANVGIMRRAPPGSHPRRVTREDNSFIGRLLTICPAEELEFVVEDETTEACDNIVLKNTLPYSIAFKVKTTSPEKYRVRPSSGLVKPGTETEVTVHLQQGKCYQNTVHKDKFLVMAMEVANESNRSFAELWKSVQKDSIMEHRLRCVVNSGREETGEEKGSAAGQKSPLLTDIAKKVDTVLEHNTHLQQTVQYLVVNQIILTLLLVGVLLYWGLFLDEADKSMATQTCLKS